MEVTPGTPASAADRAASLGLAEYQLEIYDTLLAQQDSKIPREVLPILARWLDKIDFDRLLIGRVEAGNMLKVTPRQVANIGLKFPQWMHPLIAPLGANGETPVIELWLGAKVRGFVRWRDTERMLKDLDDS